MKLARPRAYLSFLLFALVSFFVSLALFASPAFAQALCENEHSVQTDLSGLMDDQSSNAFAEWKHGEEMGEKQDTEMFADANPYAPKDSEDSDIAIAYISPDVSPPSNDELVDKADGSDDEEAIIADDSLLAVAVSDIPELGDCWISTAAGFTLYRDGVKVYGWAVTATAPIIASAGLERYWLDPIAGTLSFGLVNPYGDIWSFGTEAGWVVRGKYRDPATGYFYLADNDGTLLSPGWHVTDEFDGGLERYWIDEGAHAAVPGVSSDGWNHYTRADTGYVLREFTPIGEGAALFADNDGMLYRDQWAVGDFGYGLQRYWFCSNGRSAVGLVHAYGDVWAYGFADYFYVLRGKYRDPATGYFYMADNDGALLSPGWNTTDEFSDGMQLYWIDSGAHAAIPGIFEVDGSSYYTMPGAGYVMVDAVRWINGSWLCSDESGKTSVGSLSDNDELNNIIAHIIDSFVAIGTNELRDAFFYVANNYSYRGGSLWPTGDWSEEFAIEMYTLGSGNCYRFASLFEWIARGLGYHADVVSGAIPVRSGGTTPHGWTEVCIGGVTYVCDAEMESEHPGRNWFLNTYESAPIEYIFV